MKRWLFFPLEEILSISTEAIKTRAPKKCINKSICWHLEGTRGVPMEGAPPVANQIDLFMHFLGASRDGLVERRVEMDKISSSEKTTSSSSTLHVNTNGLLICIIQP